MSPNFMQGGLQGQSSGWGAMDGDKGPNSDALRVLNVITKENSDCKDQHDVRVTAAHICADGFLPGTGVCTTDVGKYF